MGQSIGLTPLVTRICDILTFGKIQFLNQFPNFMKCGWNTLEVSWIPLISLQKNLNQIKCFAFFEISFFLLAWMGGVRNESKELSHSIFTCVLRKIFPPFSVSKCIACYHKIENLLLSSSLSCHHWSSSWQVVLCHTKKTLQKNQHSFTTSQCMCTLLIKTQQ